MIDSLESGKAVQTAPRAPIMAPDAPKDGWWIPRTNLFERLTSPAKRPENAKKNIAQITM